VTVSNHSNLFYRSTTYKKVANYSLIFINFDCFRLLDEYYLLKVIILQIYMQKVVHYKPVLCVLCQIYGNYIPGKTCTHLWLASV